MPVLLLGLLVQRVKVEFPVVKEVMGIFAQGVTNLDELSPDPFPHLAEDLVCVQDVRCFVNPLNLLRV